MSQAQAQDTFSSSRLSLSIGGSNLYENDDNALDLRAEITLARKVFGAFHPFFGIELSNDGALYGMFGLLWDYKFNNDWFITPSLGAGLYKDGEGRDLGHAIQFRSQLDIGYEFDNAHRLSGYFSHISNAGLGDKNPGVEVFGITYSIPFNLLK